MEARVSEGGRLDEPLLPTTTTTLPAADEPMCSPSESAAASTPSQLVEIRNVTDAVQDEGNEEEQEQPWYKCPLQLVAMFSNYSTSYNVVNISMVIPILEHTIKGTTSEDVAASASSLLAGMIVGQLGGGYLGDTKTVGRLGALQLVMVLQVVASIGSALLPSKHPESFFVMLAIFRFLLGVGAGGVYPLAAVLSAEQSKLNTTTNTNDNNQHQRQHNARTHDGSSSLPTAEPQQDEDEDEDEQDQIKRVVLTFSTQGLGFITVPLISVLLLCVTSNLNVVWRLILAFGSIPGLILMGAQMWIHRKNRSHHHAIPLGEDDEEDDPDHHHHPNRTVVESAGGPPTASEAAPAAAAAQIHQNSGQRSGEGSGEPHDDEDPHTNNHAQNSELDQEDILLRDIQLLEEQVRPQRELLGWWESILSEPSLWPKLLGTAGTWFLFDVLFYGNSLFQPIVIDAAFGGSKKGGDPITEIRDTAIKSLFVYSIALPGYAVAAKVMGKRLGCVLQTPKYVMLQGFAAMAILYALLGTNWTGLKQTPVLLVGLYGLSFFFAN